MKLISIPVLITVALASTAGLAAEGKENERIRDDYFRLNKIDGGHFGRPSLLEGRSSAVTREHKKLDHKSVNGSQGGNNR